MARSLPVSVPFPEGLPKRGEIFDIPSEEDEEEIFFEGPQGTLQNKLFEIIELIHYNPGPPTTSLIPIFSFSGSSKKSKDIIERRQSAIPDKIAQIAKSMYDRDGLGFGESPQKY